MYAVGVCFYMYTVSRKMSLQYFVHNSGQFLVYIAPTLKDSFQKFCSTIKGLKAEKSRSQKFRIR